MKPETRIYLFCIIMLLVQLFIVIQNTKLEESAKNYYNACQISSGEGHV